MIRREYLAQKAKKRQQWAEKATMRAEGRFATADRIAKAIPFGQPILVGHHSERHARADQKRIHDNMDKGCEEMGLAAHHQAKASGIAQQLAHTIFSDDSNAIAALETRIAEREAEASGYVSLNAAWRKSKGDITDFAQLARISDSAAQRIAETIAAAYSWEKQPIPAYLLTNLRTNIRRDRERIAEIKGRGAPTDNDLP